MPYSICKKLAKNSSEEPEVAGANLIALCGIIFPIFYTIYLLIPFSIVQNLPLYLFSIVLLFPLLTYSSYFFNNYPKRLKSDLKLHLMMNSNEKLYSSILHTRQIIITDIASIKSKYEKEI